ncbi:UPF0182 family protein [Nocardioides marmotae]|uniref:UPF0182 family membrane protein n=1 Tax=Nocardioides marmotae TaxID=2663857 RepID=UPI00132182FD|nr:UPF0182 family protein [Nocardioides marmotae]MBC9733310.1 UPF0182 family protein [Nocardioides marmotae]MTB84419.1 UPF0182 family protein [Nocardioides marmotae]
MSELFADDPRDTPPPEREVPRRSRALIITAVVVVLGFFGLTTFAAFYTDRLWFIGADFGSVFTTLFWTRTGLFLVFGALMGIVVGVNMWLAYRHRPTFRLPSPEQTGLDRYREAVTPIRTWLLVGVALLLGVFAGTSGAGEWRSYLLWRNGTSFGDEDPYFGRDIGFYVFDLPWLHFLVDFTMAVVVVALIAAAVVHYLYGGIRLQASHDRLSGAAQVQLSVLLGIFVLAKGVDYYLDRFDLVTQDGELFTGMSYTDDHAVLPAKNILMGIAVICAVLFFLNIWRRTWILPSMGLALLALSAVLLGLIWPGIVQQFQVNPSQADKEEEYIQANIEATRSAYDVADVETEQYTASADLSTGLASLDRQTSSVPLVDPQLVRAAFEQEQQVRAYYSVADVLDVDRYSVGEEERALVLAVRELDQSGINEGDRNWSNLHTVYTHGNGIIAAYANARPRDNSAQEGGAEGTQAQDAGIEWAEGDTEDELTEATGGFETRVYYGEQSPEYSIVGKADEDDKDVELNLPTGGDEAAETTTTYDGEGDVAIGGFFNQLMYAVKYGEPNFLLSGRVNENSKILYNRQPLDRVRKVAPWLTVDADAYPAIVDGRILWILDGYTTTDRYPQAQRESLDTMTDDSLDTQGALRAIPTDEINYMRNAVKATVDAYSGEVTLYAWDEEDPILEAWSNAFPGTVTPKSEISDGLLEHLRYPEDLFKVQRYQFARYHVTDPRDFYQGNNRWEVPEDPYTNGTLQPPYRLFVRNPDDAEETFSLTSTFVPYGKNNLASFVSVNADATSEEYGRIRVLQLPNEQTDGPGLVANDFTSDEGVRQALLPLQSGGAKPVYGNLLTLPVENGLLYVQPVYTTRELSDASYPILQYVLTKYGDEVGVGNTLTESLGDLLGAEAGDLGNGSSGDGGEGSGDGGEGNGGDGPTGTRQEQIAQLLATAEEAFAAAQEALADGDLATYQEQVEAAERAVSEALSLSGKSGVASGGEDEEGSGTPGEESSPSGDAAE